MNFARKHLSQNEVITKYFDFAMKKPTTLLFILLFAKLIATAQLVTFTGTGGLPIPPGAPGQTVGITQSSNFVSGVGLLGGCATIENVTIDVQHTWVGDIAILLIGPGGQVLDLSSGNGGAGNDFAGTVFSDDAATFITTGTPPYAGTFRPEGRATSINFPYSNVPPLGSNTFASTYNGTNADGNWTLYINDFVAADVGLLISWSITFNLGGTPPVADAGPDVVQCQGLNTQLTASGGDTYAWSTSANTASITVSPLATTTYTVTVSTAGCGTDTDEVTVTVVPQPTVAFTSTTTQICGQGECVTLSVNFTGVAPFSTSFNVFGPGNVLLESGSASSPTATGGTVLVCPPPNLPPGSLTITATSVSDANCTCN